MRGSKCKAITCLLFLTGLLSCREQSPFKELSSDGLTVRLMKTQNAAEGPADMSFSVRLLPDKKLLKEKDGTNLQTDMQYRADSCFYLSCGGKKTYASLAQAIANGVPGSFEYLLSFEASGLEKGSYELVYDDKYLNKRKYTFYLGNLSAL